MFKPAFFAIALLTHLSLFGAASQGEAFERQMWQDIKERNWSDLSNRIAPYFQAVQFDGARNKDQYMNRVKALDIGDFTLHNFKVTEGSGVIVVTYNISVSETIEGNRLTSSAMRMSVWQKKRDNWQWIAHAILVPVPTAEQRSEPREEFSQELTTPSKE